MRYTYTYSTLYEEAVGQDNRAVTFTEALGRQSFMRSTAMLSGQILTRRCCLGLSEVSAAGDGGFSKLLCRHREIIVGHE